MKVNYSPAMRATSWAIPVLTIGIFIFDLMTPAGVGIPMLYVVPLVLTIFTPRKRDPVYLSLLVTGLIWVELLFNPPEPLASHSVMNRALGTFVVWAVILGLFRYKQVEQSLAETEADRTQVGRDLMSERVERAHAEGLMMAAQEARAYADTASMGAAVGRLEAEEKLQISQLRLEGIIESAMDAIITVDQNQNIVLFNRAAEQMFGCSTQEGIGQPLDRFLPARFRETHHSHVHAFGQGGVTSRKMGHLGTVSGLRTNGEEFPVEAAISYITVEGKKYYTVILRDITDRKRIEEQLRRTERVAELGTLASGMAHEIGTPMNVILGRAEYLMDRVKE
ncbi:MAG: PAS domain S-box protein, partial [Nitrospira sp.]|nr:PAS domain S-box protein [Nitrospira sp.]